MSKEYIAKEPFVLNESMKPLDYSDFKEENYVENDHHDLDMMTI